MGIKNQLGNIVGLNRVCGEHDKLQRFFDPRSSVTNKTSCYAVKPNSVREVKEIIQWANDTSWCIVPISSGPPHMHGGAYSTSEKIVILDLSEMKRIIRIDPRNMVAMVEPGVTFSDLISTLNKDNMAPFMPLVPRSTKSVLTSCLEREPITAPKHHWEPQDPLICVEAIYGNGELFRTGSAAGPGTLEEQWNVGKAQIRGLGPAQVDFVKLIQGAQGTMGVVTWANIKCKPLPIVRYSSLVPSTDLDQLIEFTYKILWKKLGTDCLILNNQTLASILGGEAQEIMMLRDELPPWVIIFIADGYGAMPEERIEYQKAEFLETAQSFGLKVLDRVSGIKSEDVAEVLSEPSKDPYWKLRLKGGGLDIFFITTLDRTSEFMGKMVQLAESYSYPVKDIGGYIQPTVQGTNCHCQFDLSFDPQNPNEKQRAEDLSAEAASIMRNMGAFFSRPYEGWADIAYKGDKTTVESLKKIKDIFDPNGIMNPGKLCF